MVALSPRRRGRKIFTVVPTPHLAVDADLAARLPDVPANLAEPLLAKSGLPLATTKHGGGRVIDSPSGSKLYVEQHGPLGAPTIILTHGWGMDSTFWGSAKRDLGGRFRLLLWDLPGLGKSRSGPAGVGLSAFAAALAALIETSEGPVVLVGHSIGGMTIQTLIQERPELMSRVAGVVLLNTTYTNPFGR